MRIPELRGTDSEERPSLTEYLKAFDQKPSGWVCGVVKIEHDEPTMPRGVNSRSYNVWAEAGMSEGEANQAAIDAVEAIPDGISEERLYDLFPLAFRLRGLRVWPFRTTKHHKLWVTTSNLFSTVLWLNRNE